MNRILTASIAALLLVGLSMPLVIAKPGEDRPGRDEMRDAREDRENRTMKLPGERAKIARHSEAFLVTINAQGLSQDNESYTISGEGRGVAKHRDDNGTVKAIAGFARINVTLEDANGTIVKEGTIRVRFIAHQNETGDWHWRLVSAGKTPSGLPKVFLHGENVTVGDGAADLDGKGFALVKVQEDDAVKRLRLRLTADVHITRL